MTHLQAHVVQHFGAAVLHPQSVHLDRQPMIAHRHSSACQSVLTGCQSELTSEHLSSQTDTMARDDLSAQLHSTDPAIGLRAVGALHRLAEQVEANHVRLARQQGWSWEQIGDALGVSRQSIHAKYGK